MLTFHCGVWQEVEELPECKWERGKLVYPGFDPDPEMIFGDNHSLHVSVYYAEDITAQYRFLVIFDTCNRYEDMLVTDFASLLQLLDKFLPIIRWDREQEAHKVLIEEHQWRVEEQGKHRQCCH